jgi:Domain of unknown function (DUF397)
MTTPVWRKSSRSNAQGGDCIEVAAIPGAVGVRDSKNPVAGHQTVSREAFANLVKRIKSHGLDL